MIHINYLKEVKETNYFVSKNGTEKGYTLYLIGL